MGDHTMKHALRILPSNLRTNDLSISSRLNFGRIGLNIAQIIAIIVCLFVFSNSSQAQDCRTGYEPAANGICVQICPPGFTRTGVNLCRKPDDYERNKFAPSVDSNSIKYSEYTKIPDLRPKLIADCDKAKVEDQIVNYSGQGPRQRCSYSENYRGAFAACVPGYSAINESVCTAVCPTGFKDVGPECQGGSYSPAAVIENCTKMFSGQTTRQGKFLGRAITLEESRRICSGPADAQQLQACFLAEQANAQNFEDIIDGCGAGFYASYWGSRAKPRPNPGPKPVEPPAPDLTGWTVCASEGGRCQFEGTAEVRYGVGNKWNIQTVTNGVDCNNAVFTDPALGLAKQCLLSPNITPNAPPDVNTRDANGNNDLHLAVSRNDLSAVNDLLNRGIDVNALNNASETPVTLAVEADNTPALLAMLAKGGDMNAALHRIAYRNREAMLRAVAGNYPIRMTNEMFDRAISVGALGIALMSLSYGVDPNRAMGHGIYSRNMQMIDAALAAGANPDTALIFAIENRMPDLILRSLDQYRANPKLAMELSIPINDPQTLALALDRGANPTIGLPLAVKASNTAMVETLLARGADANSGLMPAVESGNDQIIDILLARGANPNPAMGFAVERQKVSLVKRLLAAKAIPTDQFVLGLAGRIGNMEVVNMLLDAGGHPTSILGGAIEERNYDLSKYLLDKGADAKYGEFIETAVTVRDVRILNLLLERGADPTKGVLAAVQSGNAQILQLLIDNKADVTSPVLITVAAKKGNLGIVALLLKAGADPENGMSAAVLGGFADIVEMLIEKGADAKKPEYILQAVKMGNRDLANHLLLNGAPKDVIDETGQPLIIVAALRWDTLLVQLLLKSGVDPNAKNRAGDTALHIVANDEASKGYPKFEKMKKLRLPIVQALVDGGADVNATNAKGETVRKSLGVGDGDVKKILDAAGAVNKLGEK